MYWLHNALAFERPYPRRLVLRVLLAPVVLLLFLLGFSIHRGQPHLHTILEMPVRLERLHVSHPGCGPFLQGKGGIYE